MNTEDLKAVPKSEEYTKVVYGGEGETGDMNTQTKERTLTCPIGRRLRLWPQRHSLRMEAEVT